MLRAFRLALQQIADPAFRGVLARALLITVLVFAGLGILLWQALGFLPMMAGWAEATVEIASGLGFVLVMMFLFPLIAAAAMGLFLDEVAEAVERRHYPESPGRPLPFWTALGLSLRFAALVAGLNLLALPLYLVFLWFPPLNLILFFGLNGYLLGREYFELVAWRHLDRPEAGRLRKGNQTRLMLFGTVIAFLLSVPLVNLLAPIVATASMVHVFKKLQSQV